MEWISSSSTLPPYNIYLCPTSIIPPSQLFSSNLSDSISPSTILSYLFPFFFFFLSLSLLQGGNNNNNKKKNTSHELYIFCGGSFFFLHNFSSSIHRVKNVCRKWEQPPVSRNLGCWGKVILCKKERQEKTIEFGGLDQSSDRLDFSTKNKVLPEEENGSKMPDD